jgi:hypothetical protein
MLEWLKSALTIAAIVAAINGAFLMVGKAVIESRIKLYFDALADDYRFELKAHEQGAKIAEYISIAHSLKATDDAETYKRANQLAWELFLWLPPETYRALAHGLIEARPDQLVGSMVEVRKVLLRNRAGDLGINDIIVHAPGIGRTTAGELNSKLAK